MARLPQQAMVRVSGQYSFAGPLPPSEVLEKYNQAMPGLAERIIKMAEQQATHRQLLERAVVESNASVQKVGPYLGFVVAMTAVVGGIVLVLHGKDGYGLAAITPRWLRWPVCSFMASGSNVKNLMKKHRTWHSQGS